MGAAYSVGVFMIFVLLVAQFRSYILPLVIMAPIPLTMIGIMPGHALLGKEFTATSMIGMIALAGIIVRNSILLVVFIKQLLDEGMELEKAVVLAGAVRIKPIALTAVSAVVGRPGCCARPRRGSHPRRRPHGTGAPWGRRCSAARDGHTSPTWGDRTAGYVAS